MGARIARNTEGDYLYFDGYNDAGFAKGYIVTENKKRIPVPIVASLVYRGYGWSLLKEGRRIRLLPEE